MTPVNLSNANVNQWWWIKRIQYNKGLIFSGAFALICVIGCINVNQSSFIGIYPNLLIILLFLSYYGFYVAVANLLYTLGWVLDVALNKHNDDNFRVVLFNIGYWCSVLALPTIALACLIIDITSPLSLLV